MMQRQHVVLAMQKNLLQNAISHYPGTPYTLSRFAGRKWGLTCLVLPV